MSRTVAENEDMKLKDAKEMHDGKNWDACPVDAGIQDILPPAINLPLRSTRNQRGNF
jgi:hypothetical protein